MRSEAQLIRDLKSNRSARRYDACEELRVSSAISEDAVSALEATLSDTDPGVAEAAKRALLLHRPPPSSGRPSRPDSPATTVSPLVLPILLSPFIICLLWYSGILWEAGIARCSPPPGVAVDGAAVAHIFTWHDDNADGLVSDGESPFEGVKVYLLYEEATTNHLGQATLVLFKPGCACNCSRGEVLEVEVPSGFVPTTPVEYSLTGEDTVYTFGFRAR